MCILCTSTGCERKRIELDRNLVNPQNQIIDQDDKEDIGVKQSSYSQSLTHSAHDSAESMATPPDSDLYIREREENEGHARAYHSEREKIDDPVFSES